MSWIVRIGARPALGRCGELGRVCLSENQGTCSPECHHGGGINGGVCRAAMNVGVVASGHVLPMTILFFQYVV